MKAHELLGLFASIGRGTRSYDFPTSGPFAPDIGRDLELKVTNHGIYIKARIGDLQHPQPQDESFTLMLSWATWIDLTTQFQREAQRLTTAEEVIES